MNREQISYYQAKLRYETDASDLFAALSAQENLVVIDTRSHESFATEHIPGAINIPHRSLSEETTAHLDKEASYVTYCDGIGCNASTKGALRMAQLGFSVRELLGGLDWWRRDGFATQGENAAVGKTLSCGC
jgi:rhodanese-related sulfurtransferase